MFMVKPPLLVFVFPFYRSVLLLSNLSQYKNCACTSNEMQAQIPYFNVK